MQDYIELEIYTIIINTMKKLFGLLALVLAVVSCQNDFDGTNLRGDEVAVTLNVAVPDEATRAAGSDSGIGAIGNIDLQNDYDIRYILEVYDALGNLAKSRIVNREGDSKSTSFDLRLVPGRKYTFVVWADFIPQDQEDEKVDYHYNTSNIKAISLNGEQKANDESRDAYTCAYVVERFQSGAPIAIELKRPFAKLRVVTTDMNHLYSDLTSVKVTYTTPLYTTFNALTGEKGGLQSVASTTKVVNLTADFKYTNEADYKTNGKMTLFADYFFGAKDDAIHFELDAKDATGMDIPEVFFNTNIPVQRNYLTTVMGPVLTDAANVTVKIEGAFDGTHNVDVVEASNASDLQEAIDVAADGKETHIVLGGDIDLNDLLTRAESNPYGLLIPAGKKLVLDLNGKRVYQTKACSDHYSMILNNGNLTITGKGTVEFEHTSEGGSSAWGTYTIENRGEAVLTIDNATIRHNGCVNGETEHDTNIAIQNYEGKVVINDGTIASPEFRSLRDFTAGGEIIINGGTFLGQVWMQGLGNGSSSLTINGGSFSPDAGGYDGSSVYITNSTNVVNVAITGGIFNTKVGCFDPNKEGANGCITGGTFTTAAKEATNEALLDSLYEFVSNGDDTWTVSHKNYAWNEENTVCTIYTAAGLQWFANEVNKYSNYEYPFKDQTVLLANDIDLGGIEWTPIGDYRFSANRFCGTFDGQNYTISNFKITKKTDKNDSNKSSYGFFGNVEGIVKNLTIADATVSSYAYTGALIGRLNSGCVENCHVVNSAVSNTYWQGGILIGQVNGSIDTTVIKDCTVSKSSVSSKSAIGAISGPITAEDDNNELKITVTGCRVNDCEVIQTGSFGGNYDKYFGSLFAYLKTDANGEIVVSDCTAENTLVKGEANAPISGDNDGNIIIDGIKYVSVGSVEDLTNALKGGVDVITLGTDITVTEKWDNRYTGAKTYKAITIDGNGNTLKFACEVSDGFNYQAAFRFEAPAVVKNLTIDMSEVTGTGSWLRAISTKGDITVDNCTFIGSTNYTAGRGIAFGEGAGVAAEDIVVSVKNSTFTNWTRRGLTDNENAQDAKNVTVVNNTFTNADAYVSAHDSIVFTGNVMNNSAANFCTYSNATDATVVATGNTLDANNENNIISGFVSANVESQEGFTVL